MYNYALHKHLQASAYSIRKLASSLSHIRLLSTNMSRDTPFHNNSMHCVQANLDISASLASACCWNNTLSIIRFITITIRITTILKSLDIKPSKRRVKELTLSLSKLALLTSFVIFKCRVVWTKVGCGVKTATVWPCYDTWHLITFSMFTRYSHRLPTWLH